MNFRQGICYTDSKFTLRNFLPDIGEDQVTQSILRGLLCRPKYISSMFFYDAVGSGLFEQITRLPEYYPTRTEKELLTHFGPLLFGGRDRRHIIEIGSGDCSKISILLGAIPSRSLPAVRYTPVDVSQEAIEESADRLQERFPEIEIRGIVADFTRQLHVIPNRERRFFCFLGSTLGNLSRRQAERFFLDLGRIMLSGEELLLGVDMIKRADIVEKAYNDSRGITARFNRNILNVVNRLVGTDFDPLAFDHLAFYNRKRNRIEMHLRASKEMQISCPAAPRGIRIRCGEAIHTENSHKYTPDCIRRLAATGGLQVKKSVTDDNRWFLLVHLLKK